MTRLALLLPLALVACTSIPVPLPPPPEDVRPVVAMDRLQGRWTIVAVNGRQADGLWLDLGGEGLGTVTRTDRGILVGSPQPPTRAHLGCNDLSVNGWTRNGDKLTLGMEMARMTERGCDPATMALETQADRILSKTMTMEFAPPGRLRLINEKAASISSVRKAEVTARHALTAAFAATLAACATAPQSSLPSHQNKVVGEVIMTRGLLVQEGNCVVMNGGFGRIVPIWPSDTRISDVGVIVPGASGDTLLRFGEGASLHGVRIADLTGSRERSLPGAGAAGACGKQAFLVNRVETQRSMQARAPNPPSSGGLLSRQGTCLVFNPPEGTLLPIWPEGTVVTEETVTTPDLRGHPPLIVGGLASVEGRYVYADDGSLQRAAGPEAAKCARTGMIVEKARRVYIARDAAEKVAMSDAVLIVELVELNPSDPLSDGFLTTMVTRVVEPLTGRFRAGEIVKLRHGAGRDPVRGWQATPHDPLFEAMGPAKVKPGDRLLLFVNQDLYRQSAEHYGRGPVPGYIGVGGGIYRLDRDQIIDDAYLPTLKSLDEVRRLARKR